VRILDRRRPVPGLSNRDRALRAGAGHQLTGDQGEERDGGGLAAVTKEADQHGTIRRLCTPDASCKWLKAHIRPVRVRKVCALAFAPAQILQGAQGRRACQMRALRSRNALAMTDTELKLIAAAAIMGLSRMPKNG
jgi:hypothetical protein